MTDDDIRSVLTPLRIHEPHPDVERLLVAGRRERGSRRRRRTVALVAAGAMAAGVVGASLPVSDAPPTARSVLRAAAAKAADQPPERLTGIRYARIDYRILLQPQDGGPRYELRRPLEFWARHDASTRTEFGAGAFVDLEGRPHPGPAGVPPIEPSSNEQRRLEYENLDVAGLPTEPATARREIEAAMRKTFMERTREAPREDVVDELVTRSAIDLLSFASLTPAQREAVFQVLAAMPGARATGRDQVELPTGAILGASSRTTIVIDPDTGALRSRSERPSPEPYPGADRVEETWIFTASRDVAAIGERP
jgi:hypothetical protein